MTKDHRIDRRWAAVLVLALVALIAGGAPPATAKDGWPQRGGWPLAGSPEVVRGFDPPAERWGRGHRGVDLAAPAGSEVLAGADGVVTFAGVVAGRPVLTISHGRLRTTYEPVTATVAVGARVRMGQVVGRLEPGHCQPVACLHWGLLRGDDYLDPMLLPGVGDGNARLRLLPAGSGEQADRVAARRAEALRAASAAAGPVGKPGVNGFVMPVAGPITSRYGPRLHPVLGVYKLHDGTDFGAACGTPIRAARDGTVVQRDLNPGYGNRLVLDHGEVDGRRLRTSYNHAIDYSVGVGDRVERGQVVGRVGSTGYSTGCHLHLMLWVDGVLVDPQQWL